MRTRTRIGVVAASVLCTFALTAPVIASPHAPTNGGNGAGQSGQCTGPASERPASCQSSK